MAALLRSHPFRLVLGLSLAAGAGLAARAAELGPAPNVAPRVLASGERILGLRVAAQPGDVVLENAAVSAVIRKSDGALVDFRRRRPVVSTSDQLGPTGDIDGLWDLVPVALGPGGERIVPEAARVSVHPDSVEVNTVLSRRQRLIGSRVRYTLDEELPKLHIHASFHAQTPLPSSIEVGLSLRWGNTSYYVDGNPAPLTAHSGFVRWAGRPGADGDLLIRALAPAAFLAEFQARERGFQGPLNAIALRSSSASRNVVAVYELSYERLPIVPAPERPRGRLEIQLTDEQQRPLAGKVTLFPDGQPNRVFPDDGGLEGADRFAWTGNGRIVCEPPAGRYELNVSAGPERALSRHSVVIGAGATSRVSTTLRRVVSTPGWTSADLHLHQAPSVDADISLEARVIAVAAEGVELAVATDHYAVTDLAPTIAELIDLGALARPILSIPGTEVSTLGHRFGHFNVFPLPLDADVEYRDTTPARLFASARKASPNGVLQVNHPRWAPNLGYFTRFDLDPLTGLPKKPGYDPSFDLLEVYNGDDATDLGKVEKVLSDYMRLLGHGRRYVATGSSDSHKLAFLDPGLPRTLIAHGEAGGDEADARAPIASLLGSLKAGRVVVTSGPYVDASIDGKGPGQTASGVGRQATLKLRVRAAPWVSVRRLRVLQGPNATAVQRIEIPKSEAIVRYEHSLSLAITEPTFVLVTVAGDEPLPNTSSPQILPFAFTNPIWIEP